VLQLIPFDIQAKFAVGMQNETGDGIGRDPIYPESVVTVEYELFRPRETGDASADSEASTPVDSLVEESQEPNGKDGKEKSKEKSKEKTRDAGPRPRFARGRKLPKELLIKRLKGGKEEEPAAPKASHDKEASASSTNKGEESSDSENEKQEQKEKDAKEAKEKEEQRKKSEKKASKVEKVSETSRKVHAPYFPEEREETWYLILGHPATGSFVNLVKIGSFGAKTKGKLMFAAPNSVGVHQFALFLMCDGYLGCDRQKTISITVQKDPNAKQTTQKGPVEKKKEESPSEGSDDESYSSSGSESD